MEQIFLNESLKFYVRCFSEKPQLVYANINLAGHRFVISTGVKVKPEQFSVKKQLAQESNLLPALDNFNNNIVNNELKSFKDRFTKYLNYLLEKPEKIEVITNEIYNFVAIKPHKAMARKYKETLEFIMLNFIQDELKNNRISNDRATSLTNSVKCFLKFIEEKNLKDGWEILNLKTYNTFAEYLTNEKKVKNKPLNITTINFYLSNLKTVVSNICDKELQPDVDTSKWKRLKVHITKNEQKTSNYLFTSEQLQSIMDLELTGMTEVVRDMFVFACNIGQRPADCCRIIQNGNRFYSNGIQVIQLVPHKTRKTDIKATIPIFNVELVDSLIKKFKENPLHIEYLNMTINQRNQKNAIEIKKIFKKAGIKDEYKKIVQRGNNIYEETANQAESSHIYLARHYFITLCLKNNMPVSEVIQLTGHNTEQMVNEVYSHLNGQEKADLLTASPVVRKMAGKEDEVEEDEVTLEEIKQMILNMNKPNPLLQQLNESKQKTLEEILFNKKLNN